MNVQPARPGEALVGCIVNPRSGQDIRRLVARASVFPNTEKVMMLQRVLTSLGAVGVHRVVVATDLGGVAAGWRGAVEAHRPDRDPPWPPVEFLTLPLRAVPPTSIAAAEALVPPRRTCAGRAGRRRHGPRGRVGRAAMCRSRPSPPARTTPSPRSRRRPWSAWRRAWSPRARWPRRRLPAEQGPRRRPRAAAGVALVDVAVATSSEVGARASGTRASSPSCT